MNVKNGNSLNMKLWTIKGERCSRLLLFRMEATAFSQIIQSTKMLQSNLTHQRGIGGAQKNYRRPRRPSKIGGGGAHKLSAAALRGRRSALHCSRPEAHRSRAAASD